jgi:hypothetical protein
MYKMRTFCGGGAVHWASLSQFVVDACHRGFYCVYKKTSPVGPGGTHLFISYCRTELFLLHPRFLRFQCLLFFTLIIGLFDEGYGVLQSS